MRNLQWEVDCFYIRTRTISFSLYFCKCIPLIKCQSACKYTLIEAWITSLVTILQQKYPQTRRVKKKLQTTCKIEWYFNFGASIWFLRVCLHLYKTDQSLKFVSIQESLQQTLFSSWLSALFTITQFMQLEIEMIRSFEPQSDS